jgi:DNA-binding transcriptional regulator YiaG
MEKILFRQYRPEADLHCEQNAAVQGRLMAQRLRGSGVSEAYDKVTGKAMMEIIDLPGLIASILKARVLHPRKLSGDDLKYIRSALLMRSAEVADKLDITPEHYSRCEAGTKTLSSSTEKSYRMFVYLLAASKHTAVQAHLSKMKEENEKCRSEEAKEIMQAFRSVFLEMKIQHVFDAEEELSFSFSWKRRREDEYPGDCGKEDGKWRKEPQLEAA